MNSAPVALFAYQRPDHLQKVLEALAANPEAALTHLYVFSDAPRDPAAERGVAEVRRVISAIGGFAEVTTVLRDVNMGLARSIVEGVSHVCQRHGRVIVLEDDLVVSRYFLAYMNAALDMYADAPEVASIHGYSLPTGTALPETFFLRGADCWGWATWSRAWNSFEPDGARLLNAMEKRGLARSFDLDGTYGFTAMLRDQVEGRVDSWAVRWHATAYLAGMLTLHPGRSLVRNIGVDGTGTHVRKTAKYDVELSERPVDLQPLPAVEDAGARESVKRYFRSIRPSMVSRVRTRLARLVRAAGRQGA